jgi:tight adherence protein B
MSGAGRLVPLPGREPAGMVRMKIASLSPGMVPVLATACAVATVAAGVVDGLAIDLATGALGATAVTRRRCDADRRDVLAATRLLVAELEAGTRPDAALDAAAEVAPRHAEHLRAAARADRTSSGASELLRSVPALADIGHAWSVAAVTGARLADVLSRVAADHAGRDDQRRRVAAAVAGARSSAGLLAGLPVLGVALGAAMGARPLSMLLGTSAGRAVCCAGALLDVVGIACSHRLIRRAEGG